MTKNEVVEFREKHFNHTHVSKSREMMSDAIHYSASAIRSYEEGKRDIPARFELMCYMYDLLKEHNLI